MFDISLLSYEAQSHIVFEETSLNCFPRKNKENHPEYVHPFRLAMLIFMHLQSVVMPTKSHDN